MSNYGTIRRIKREIKEMNNNPLVNNETGPINNDNLFKWKAIIIGQKDTPYVGGEFILNIDIPAEYPFRPPIVRFVSEIFHCNINANGFICLDILSEKWSPALTISNVVSSIKSLLSNPNLDKPLVHGIAKIYRSDKEKHDRIARDWTRKYAM